MNTRIQLKTKNGKLILCSPNNIGRATGLACHMMRNDGEFKLENLKLENMDGTKWKIPLFYKFTLEKENSEEDVANIFLVGPNVFLDNSTLKVYKIRSYFNKSKKLETKIMMLQLDSLDDVILDIYQEFTIHHDAILRTQFIKDNKDGAPHDMIIYPDGKTFFQRRWKWLI